ncbi:MAG: formate dehydrogenase accessory sulfurtransferase FdhD [Chloroflexota bacterium]
MHQSYKNFEVITYLPDKIEESKTHVIVEKPIDISIDGKYWITLMCTPTNLEELAIGFLYNEGLINSFQEIKMVEVCHNGNNIDIWLNHAINLPKKWQRTSGCTGGSTSVILSKSLKTSLLPTSISPQKISLLLDLLLKNQNLYSISGGVHSSALSDGEKILIVMEDIGRHNTLDKISGFCLMKNSFPLPGIIISTGRISSEMLQKSARIGASIIISRTSPSSLSIDLALQLGICIIGYARKDRFKIFSHAEYVEISK